MFGRDLALNRLQTGVLRSTHHGRSPQTKPVGSVASGGEQHRNTRELVNLEKHGRHFFLSLSSAVRTSWFSVDLYKCKIVQVQERVIAETRRYDSEPKTPELRPDRLPEPTDIKGAIIAQNK